LRSVGGRLLPRGSGFHRGLRQRHGRAAGAAPGRHPFRHAERGGTPYEMVAVASGGRFLALDGSGRFYSGTFTHDEDNGALSATNIVIYAANAAHGTSFDHIGYPIETGADFQNALATSSGWTGNIVGSATSTFSLAYDRDTDALDSDLGFVADQWQYVNASYVSNLFVLGNGTTGTTTSVNGAAYDCGSNGTAAVINARYNIYSWQATPSGSQCASTLPLTGRAFLSANGAALTVLLASADQFFAGFYQRQ
jgi:hypothetical protein